MLPPPPLRPPAPRSREHKRPAPAPDDSDDNSDNPEPSPPPPVAKRRPGRPAKKQKTAADAKLLEWEVNKLIPTGVPLHAIASNPQEPYTPEKVKCATDAYADHLLYLMKQDMGLALTRVKTWEREIDELKAEEMPGMVVAVLGATGAGKTSLINALLGYHELLPTSCVRACTATVVEVSYHAKETFEADIICMTREEWKAEFILLLKDLIDEDGKQRSIACKETLVAKFKILAVHPEATFEQLQKCAKNKNLIDQLLDKQPIKQVLGMTKLFSSRSSSEFAKEVTPYIESSDDMHLAGNNQFGTKGRVAQLWPVVTRIKCRVKANVLSTGVTLVDLPGCQDTNTARSGIADEYKKNARAFYIVAPIVRAISDKVAEELLGDAFKRQLLMDGSLNDRAITFICSKTEQVVASEVVRLIPGVSKDVKALTMRLEKNDEDIKILECKRTVTHEKVKSITGSTIGKDADWQYIKRSASTQVDSRWMSSQPIGPARNGVAHSQNRALMLEKPQSRRAPSYDVRGGSVVPSSSAKSQMIVAQLGMLEMDDRDTKDKIDKAKHAKKEMQRQRDLICAVARNKYCKRVSKEDFRAGIKALDEEDAERADPENFDPSVEQRDYSKVDLPVFCVSSTDYFRIKGMEGSDTDPLVFSNEDETEIPQLRKHTRGLNRTPRDDFVQQRNTKLCEVAKAIEVYLTTAGRTCSALGDRHLTPISERLRSLRQRFDEILSEKTSELKDELTHALCPSLRRGATSAEGAAVTTVTTFGENMHYNTYRATMIRQGVFKKDLNKLLAEPVVVETSQTWGRVFDAGVNELFDDLPELLLKATQACFLKIERHAHPSLLTSLRPILEHQLPVLKTSFRRTKTKATQQIQDIQKGISRRLVPDIQERLSETYLDVGAIRGRGCSKEMKRIMRQHVHDHAHDLFNYSTKQSKERLEGLGNSVQADLNRDLEKTVNSIDDKISCIWDNMRATPDQIKFRQAVKMKINQLVAVMTTLAARMD